MNECPKCKRHVVTYAQFCESGATEWDCCGEDDLTCKVIVDAFNHGMREGFAIAEEHATVDSYMDWNMYDEGVEAHRIDWTEARAELERRLSGKERGDG